MGSSRHISGQTFPEGVHEKSRDKRAFKSKSGKGCPGPWKGSCQFRAPWFPQGMPAKLKGVLKEVLPTQA